VTTQTKILLASTSGLLLLLSAIFAHPLGIPEPYNLLLLFAAIYLISFGLRLGKKLKKEKEKTVAPSPGLDRRKHFFSMMVLIAVAVNAFASYWLPITPNTPPILCSVIPLISFPILVGGFLYVCFKQKR